MIRWRSRRLDQLSQEVAALDGPLDDEDYFKKQSIILDPANAMLRTRSQWHWKYVFASFLAFLHFVPRILSGRHLDVHVIDRGSGHMLKGCLCGRVLWATKGMRTGCDVSPTE